MLMSSQVKFFMVFKKVHQAKELANLFKKTFTILDSKCNLWSSLYLGSRKRRNLAVSLFILYRLLLLWTSWFACMSNVHFDFMSCFRIWKKTKGIRLDISKQFRSLIFGFHFCIVRIVGKKFLNQHKTNHLINFEYLVWIWNSTNSDTSVPSTKTACCKKLRKKLTSTYFLPFEINLC